VNTPADAIRHSPALWGLLAGVAAFGVLVVGTVAWNVYDHRADVRRWLRL
jgi:hypothetical protein